MGLDLYRKKFKIEEQLERLVVRKSWKKDLFVRCFACDEMILEEKGFQTQFGLLCLDCIEKELKLALGASFNTKGLSLETVFSFLEGKGSFFERLLALWNFTQTDKLLLERGGVEERERYYNLLLKNLVFSDSGTPLSSSVRRAAQAAAVSCGKNILPYLLKLPEGEYGTPFLSTIKVSLKIDSSHQGLIELCRKGAELAGEKVRKELLLLIAPLFTEWSKKLLKVFLHDKSGALKHMAAQKLRDPAYQNLGSEKAIVASPVPVVEKPQGSGKDNIDMQLISINKVDHQTNRYLNLRCIVDGNYTATNLKKMYPDYLQHFFRREYFEVAGSFAPGKIKKAKLVDALTELLVDKENFLKLLDMLGPKVKEIMSLLVFRRSIYALKEIENNLHVEILDPEKTSHYDNFAGIRARYLLFQFDLRSSYSRTDDTIFLDELLLNVFRSYLPLPDNAELVALAELPHETFCLYQDNNEILENLQLYSDYISQGNLKLGKNTGDPLKSSYIKMFDSCAVREFFPNGAKEDKGVLKTKLLCEFFLHAGLKNVQNSPQFLKKMINDFFNCKNYENRELRSFLWHIKGSAYQQKQQEREKRVRNTLDLLLKELPEGKWISLENLLDHILCYDMDLEIMKRGRSDFFFNQADDYGSSRRYIDKRNYNDVVLEPFVKTMIHLFAAFGLLDIAFDEPANNRLQEKGSNYLCPFDGLRYLRLTALGSYVTGRSDSFASEVKKEEAELYLDDKRLIVNLRNMSKIVEILLESIGEKITVNSYKISFNSFLKDCKKEHDIKRKIKTFESYLADKLPPLWQSFLAELKNKVNPLQEEGEYRIFKLREDRELLSLLAGDDLLKKLVLKAEEYHILIKSCDVRKVRKRLEEFGYFIDSL